MGNECNECKNFDFSDNVNKKKIEEKNQEFFNNYISELSNICNSCLIDNDNLKVDFNVSCFLNPFLDFRNADKKIGKKEENNLILSNLNYNTWFDVYKKNFEINKSNVPLGLSNNKINQLIKIINEDKFEYYNLSKSEENLLKYKTKLNKNNSKRTLSVDDINKGKNTKGKKNTKEKRIINKNQNLKNKNHNQNKNKNFTDNNENSIKNYNDNTLKCKPNLSTGAFLLKNETISSITKKNSFSSQNSIYELINQNKILFASEKNQYYDEEEENSYTKLALKKQNYYRNKFNQKKNGFVTDNNIDKNLNKSSTLPIIIESNDEGKPSNAINQKINKIEQNKKDGIKKNPFKDESEKYIQNYNK